MKLLLLLLNLFFMASTAFADRTDFQALTPTPPMGWNSYDCYGLCVTEQQVLDNAQYMADHLLDYGWEYIVIDGRWFQYNSYPGYSYEANDTITIHHEYNIDHYGRLIPSIEKFPSSKGGKGFKPLIDNLHAKGLKFGLHLMRGLPKKAYVNHCPIKDNPQLTVNQIAIEKNACGWSNDCYQLILDHEGAQEYYNSVFRLFAEWGVDFVKVDDISNPYCTKEIEMIRKAIDQSGRPMVLSLSPGEAPLNKGSHVASYANMWRIVGDLWDTWRQVKHLIQVSANWSPYIGNGTWPDCDMIPLGHLAISQHPANGKERDCRLSKAEQQTLLSIMAVAKSPLMFGGALPCLDECTKAMITNREILDLNQHSIGNRVVFIDLEKQIWMAECPDNKGFYIALFNISDKDMEFDVNLKAYGKTDDRYNVKDLWSKELTQIDDGRLKCNLKPHESQVFLLFH